MIKKTVLLFCVCFSLHSSGVPDFENMGKSKGVVFLLTTPRSGSNLLSSSLSIITRKPISWIAWGNTVFDPDSKRREHPSYNRLGLDLVSDRPVLYRTHYDYDKLEKVPSKHNQLIFLTRNPKELLFRKFSLEANPTGSPNESFIGEFLDQYLQPFRVYESWSDENRAIVYYEDFIVNGDEILLQLLQFINEEPRFLDDFLKNKQQYMDRLLESYKVQHKRNAGGRSSSEGPKAIYYSKNASPQTLAYIDAYLQRAAPEIWEKYLKRYAS